MLIINQEYIIRVIIAGLLGALVGLERKTKHFGIGLRTSSIISITSCSLVLVGLSLEPTSLSRIIQGIITGIGFIGGAIIWKHKKDHQIVHGITTAACVWFLTAIGIFIGVGLYFEGVLITIITLIVLLLKRIGLE